MTHNQKGQIMRFLKKLFTDREALEPVAEPRKPRRDPIASSQPLDYVAETSFSWQGGEDGDSGYDPYDTARLRASPATGARARAARRGG